MGQEKAWLKGRDPSVARAVGKAAIQAEQQPAQQPGRAMDYKAAVAGPAPSVADLPPGRGGLSQGLPIWRAQRGTTSAQCCLAPFRGEPTCQQEHQELGGQQGRASCREGREERASSSPQPMHSVRAHSLLHPNQCRSQWEEGARAQTGPRCGHARRSQQSRWAQSKKW